MSSIPRCDVTPEDPRLAHWRSQGVHVLGPLRPICTYARRRCAFRYVSECSPVGLCGHADSADCTMVCEACGMRFSYYEPCICGA